MSTITLTSSPAGAAIWIDGKDTGKRTPTPVEVDKTRRAVTITLKLAHHADLVLRKQPVAADFTRLVKLKRRTTTTTTAPGRGSGPGLVDDSKLERPE